jgi:hypothetical protein
MVWNSYVDEYGADAENNDNSTWEIRINDEHLDFFEDKSDAVMYLIDEIDILSNNEFLNNITDFGYLDESDFYYTIIDSCAVDFYDEIDKICDKFNIKEEFKLINLDNEEPEFGEL